MPGSGFSLQHHGYNNNDDDDEKKNKKEKEEEDRRRKKTRAVFKVSKTCIIEVIPSPKAKPSYVAQLYLTSLGECLQLVRELASSPVT